MDAQVHITNRPGTGAAWPAVQTVCSAPVPSACSFDTWQGRRHSRELEQLTDLPAPLGAWLVEEGVDATDDPAVWVCALI